MKGGIGLRQKIEATFDSNRKKNQLDTKKSFKTPISWPPGVSALDTLNDSTWQRHLAEKNRCFKFIEYKSKQKIL